MTHRKRGPVSRRDAETQRIGACWNMAHREKEKTGQSNPDGRWVISDPEESPNTTGQGAP